MNYNYFLHRHLNERKKKEIDDGQVEENDLQNEPSEEIELEGESSDGNLFL